MIGMKEGSIAVITGLILLGVIAAVILKTAVINYRLGDRGYKAALAITLMVLALFCAAFVVGTGYDIKSIVYQLMDSRTLDPRWVAALKEELIIKRSTFYITTAAGWSLLGLYFILYRNIQKVARAQQAKYKIDRWDWNKILK